MKKKMLIVDDSDDLRRLLRTAFSLGEYETFEAENGLDALRLAESVFPDIFVLDIMMPGMDGLEVCCRIRANPRLKMSVVILLTGRTPHDPEAGMKAGADCYMAKPFSPAELKATVAKLYDEKQSVGYVQGPGNRGQEPHSFPSEAIKRTIFPRLVVIPAIALLSTLAPHYGWLIK